MGTGVDGSTLQRATSVPSSWKWQLACKTPVQQQEVNRLNGHVQVVATGFIHARRSGGLASAARDPTDGGMSRSRIGQGLVGRLGWDSCSFAGWPCGS